MTAEQEFAKWFRKNYSGPDTIIYDPDWHAPKILNAARHALKDDTSALIAAAYEAAAQKCEQHASGEVGIERQYLLSHAAYFRGSAIPDDAKSAHAAAIAAARGAGIREALAALITPDPTGKAHSHISYLNGHTVAKNQIITLLKKAPTDE